MSIDAFDPHRLTRVINEKANQGGAGLFLLNTHGQTIFESDQEDIYFDVVSEIRRITPFVSPLIEGKVVDRLGYATKSFRPAYAKDKRRFRPQDGLKRRAGESFSGDLSPAQRISLAIGEAMDEQLAMLDRREEVMMRDALYDGQITVSGEDYPTQVVDYGRHSDLTKTLLTTARWGESGVSPWDDVESWRELVQTHSGAVPNMVTMDSLAWKLFKDDPKIDSLLDQRRLNPGMSIYQGFHNENPAGNKADFKGAIGPVEFYVYQDNYIDEDGNAQAMMPDYTVLITNPVEALGQRCYGLIQDHDSNLVTTRYFMKSWLQKDPSVRWLLLQSAPLVALLRPNATFRAKVR